MDDSSSHKEIEDGLKDFGITLINPPSSSEELLNLLDKVECLLIKVGQAPADSMKDALRPVMRAMVGSELLKHADTDVKVSVVSCITELSRITAPQQPYDDGLMKEIFQLIVRAFEELSHSGCNYYKAVNVLETVADVKVCVILLDLECDALVIKIFQLFLRVIRPDHPNVVFTSMEEIMTLLIEESDEISMELLQPLLDSLRKENQICSPISSKLGEKVLKECASTVRPCLLEALKSKGMNLDDYAEIVAALCNEMPEGEQMTENKNVTNAVYPVKVAFPSAAVICEMLLEDGTPSDINGASSKKAKKKESGANKGAHLEVLVPEGDVLQSQDKRNRSCKGTACSKRKPRQRSRKSGSVPKGDVHTTSGLNVVKRGGNLTDAEESPVQQVDGKTQKNDRVTIDIHEIEESRDEEIKLSLGDENLSSQLAKTKRRRKLSMRKDEDSKKRRFTKNYGEEVVGTRIRVWWPLDKVFYEGAISTFDPVKRKHEITYDDGVIENLNLSKERWEIVEDNPSDKKHEADLQCNAVSSIPSTKKKAKRTSSTKKESGVSSSKRSKRNAQEIDIESLDIPITHKMNDVIDVGCETSIGEKEVVDKEDNDITQKQRSKTCEIALESSSMLEDHPSDKSFCMQYVQKHEAPPQSNDVSSVPSTKKKAKRTSSTKKEPGVSSSNRTKRNAQKSDISSLDLPTPDNMNDGADVGCGTSSGKKEVVDKEDNDITQKQRSKTCEVALENSLTLEDHPSDKKHESDLQSNDVSSVPSTKKKAKRTFSMQKEPGVTSSKRSKRNAQKSDIESRDVPTPDKMNDASDVGCETSCGKKDLVDKEDSIIAETESKSSKVALESSSTLEDHPSDKSFWMKYVQKHDAVLQKTIGVSSVPSTNKKAKRTSTKRETGVSSSKRCKRNAQKSDIEPLDIPIPDMMNDAIDVGCKTSRGQKELVHKEDNMVTEAELKTLEVALESSLTLVD
ncbi:sister chromatid cohesion protein PDS5 homolog D-like isoform X1 [Lycium ferocissimum]|uniref:sister chromatid cohesion protein PDS5 homolog D-like isoform X1 n=1 Tax=Lycium ferocissimum TaxID=112874 RepID=UPI0028157E14|nr:sister chromatid cohesion protein PDS5 homolog D-like isoform X1 [Lycium ferocissimum]